MSNKPSLTSEGILSVITLAVSSGLFDEPAGDAPWVAWAYKTACLLVIAGVSITYTVCRTKIKLKEKQ